MVSLRGKLLRSTLLISSVLLLSGTSAVAQQVFGSIYGNVTDPSGSAVANAKVTVTDTTKGTSFEVQTNESGAYSKTQLIPDPYKVSIEAPGFQKVVSNEITVQVDQASKFDAAMQVGNVEQTVEVTAAAPLLQTDRADVATTFTSKEINDLPNIGRNLQSMELLNPGTAKIGWQHASDENPQGSVQMVTNGQLFDSMGYQLDGTTNQDPILGIIVINPTFDSVSEVKQANQDFDAEFEYVGGGNANYSTKSGANQFHGDAFEYLQVNTPGFTTFARNPFSNLPAALYRQNQYGGSIAGRIIKDKLFFFGDAQLNRQAQGGTVTTSVPTLANRNGDFSDWLRSSPNYNNGTGPNSCVTQGNCLYQIYDPTSGDSKGQGRKPFVNNIIPANLLTQNPGSAQAMKILNYFPLPNYQQYPNQPYVGNYVANGDLTIAANQWDTREDYVLNEKHSFFGRYSYAQFEEGSPGVFGAVAGGPAFAGPYAGTSQALNMSLSAGWTYTASATTINEFRVGWMRYHVFDTPQGYGTQPAADAGIPGLNLDKTYTSGMPYFDIQAPNYDYKLGYALGVNSCNCPLTQTEKQIQFVDNLTHTTGNHSFKVGADIRYAQNLRVPSDSHRAGELTFGTGPTGTTDSQGNSLYGVGLASFLLGDVTSFSRYVSSSTNAAESQPRDFFYGQDTWRATPKLTLTLGVRWELVFPESVNAPGNGATLNLSNGLMYVFGSGNSVSAHGIQTMNWHNLAPRAGIAYQLNPKTVVRAGYGWSYDLGVFGSNFGHNVTQNPPVLSYQQTNNNAAPFSSVFNLRDGPSLPTPVQVSQNGTYQLPNGINPKFRPVTVTLPQVYQYNASIQRQVTSKIAITASYVGNVDRHNFNGTSNTINPNEAVYIPGGSASNANRPYFNRYGWTQDLSYYCNCANEMYNSLQVTAQVRALDGLNLQGSYTYQRQYGTGWDPYDSNYYFLYDRKAGEGYSNTLPRNQITFTESYDIPFGRQRKFGANVNRAVDFVAGGWNLGGVTQYYSGFPFSPTLSNYPGQPYAGPKSRPNLGTGDPYAGGQSRDQWFAATSAAFASPAPGTFGNYPINTLFGPRFIEQDLSLSKSFAITEKLSFLLRTDARNVFNHTNLGLPDNNIQDASAGRITSIAAGAYMRSLQFSGTIRF